MKQSGQENSIERQRLAAIISGASPLPVVEDGDNVQLLLAAALDEGVVGLTHWRLTEASSTSSALRDGFADAARELAAASMLREAECRRVLARLGSARIPVLLMKGSALAYWLYDPAGLRDCVDIDLLFPTRSHAEQAAQALTALGYTMHHRPADLSYELLCRREIGSMQIDLDMHWRLVNAPLFAETFDFEELHADSIALSRLAADARGLSPTHAFLHACIHRAVNVYLGIGDGLKWLYDLHLLGARLSDEQWQAVLTLSRTRGLSGTCAAGIDAATRMFGTAVPASVSAALQAAIAHETLDTRRLHEWKYMQARNLFALPWRARPRWLWQRLCPPLGYLRGIYGADLGLAQLWLRRLRNALRRLRS